MSRLFPYRPRAHQVEMMTLFGTALAEGRHLISEAGTGSGKTICALAPALEYALENDHTIIYLTRTHSQQRQVLHELGRINRACDTGVFGIGLQGRAHLCPLVKGDRALQNGAPDELSAFCSHRKKLTLKALSSDKPPKNVCRYYYKLCKCDVDELQSWVSERSPAVEVLAEHCETQGICTYELLKQLIPEATLVTAPYIYFFHSMLRKNLLDNLCTSIEDVILIVDEAHNLPEYARELGSIELSLNTIQLALKETQKFGERDLYGVQITEFLGGLGEVINGLRHYIHEERDDGLVPESELGAELMAAFKFTSHKLAEFVDLLTIYGETIRERKRKDGKLPRSYIHKTGMFLSAWGTLTQEYHVKLIREPGILEAYCLDPCVVTAAVRDCHASLHMSGTLKPLAEYRDSIGLVDAKTASFPSPFPKEHLMTLYVDDVSTRYEAIMKDDEILNRIKSYVVRVCNDVGRNLIVFFPSFKLMDKFIPLTTRINRPLYIEHQAMQQHSLMATLSAFKANSGSVLFSVAGGRISEGLDFPAETLELIVLVGLPYPKPTAKQQALQYYYDMKFGKGWEYTVRTPTLRRTRQCIGRLIRDEQDRGVALILDKRARGFKNDIPLKETHDALDDIHRFFKHIGA